MQGIAIDNAKSKVVKFEDIDGVKTIIVDVRSLQPEDNRWRVSWDACCVDNETVIDVFGASTSRGR